MTWKVPEKYRSKEGFAKIFGKRGDPYGSFKVLSPDPVRVHKTDLIIVASPGMPDEGIHWEHVSVHAQKNIAGKWKDLMPTWLEMCHVKDLFWDPEDCVMQLHVPSSKHINTHNFTLHLWRPTNIEIPLPPEICV